MVAIGYPEDLWCAAALYQYFNNQFKDGSLYNLENASHAFVSSHALHPFLFSRNGISLAGIV